MTLVTAGCLLTKKLTQYKNFQKLCRNVNGVCKFETVAYTTC